VDRDSDLVPLASDEGLWELDADLERREGGREAGEEQLFILRGSIQPP